MPAALIQPNFDYVIGWLSKNHPEVKTDLNSIVSSQIVKDRFQLEVDATNKKFGQWEQVKLFELTPEVWSIDAGHLTPTMKLKRKYIKERYIDLYKKIYLY